MAPHFFPHFRRLCSPTARLLSLVAFVSAGLSLRAQADMYEVDGQVAADGTSITLSWPQDDSTSMTISRRLLGETGTGTWDALYTASEAIGSYTDTTIVPGVSYEYKVAGNTYGYWLGGVDVPATMERGIALVVVDETIAESIAPELERFMQDLAGDGWRVVEHEAPRSVSDAVANFVLANDLRQWVIGQYEQQPEVNHTLILIGHVPVVKSGYARPDGHEFRAFATDLFYADTNGTWTDTTDSGTTWVAGDGVLDQTNVPGDGHIEMQVGRVDFYQMTIFDRDEVTLLKDYLNKNHQWRQGRLGDLRQAYWDKMAYDESPAEQYGALNIVGPSAMVQGGHHDVGEQQPWLWGVDFGDYNGQNYPNYANKSIFAINFGSYKLEWDKYANAMRGMLAQPWYVLTVGWGVRPNWFIHHMALGETIGYSHLRTVNNGSLESDPGLPNPFREAEYVPQAEYSSMLNAVWINLMGDPTLRAFPIAPPTAFTAVDTGGAVQLSWTASAGSEVGGYVVLRAESEFGPYEVLNEGALVTETNFTDAAPLAGAWYMVRAQKLEQVHAGSFYNFSQGAFAQVGNQLPVATDASYDILMNETLTLDFSGTDADGDALSVAVVGPPQHGTLVRSDGQWLYTPESDFSGVDTVSFTVFDGTSSSQGAATIQVTDPGPAVTLVSPVNNYSTVTAGADVILRASVTDGADLSSHWEVLGGPGSVQIDTPDAAETVAIFPVAGTYELAFTASSGGYTTTRTCRVHVDAAAFSYLSQDIGNATATSSSSYDPEIGSLTVAGAGARIYTEADEFHFDGNLVEGDFDVSAKVSFTNWSTYWSEAGLMVRESLEPGAINANVVMTGSGSTLIYFQYRMATDGTSTRDSNRDQPGGDLWLRLTRTGDVVSSFYSSDGETWWLINTVTLDLSETCYVGTCVSSSSSSRAQGALFENVDSIFPVRNAAPSVDAGSGAAGTTSESISLSGMASDDGYPQEGSLNVAWVPVSGVGPLQLAKAQSLTTTASATTAGEYVLRLEASDGWITTADAVSFTLTASAAGYEGWASGIDWGNFDSSPTADANHNGVPNLLEYAMNLDPVGASDPARLPQLALVTVDGVEYVELSLRERQDDPTVSPVIQVSADLKTWNDQTVDDTALLREVAESDVDGDGLTALVHYYLKRDGGQVFVRAKVEQP